MFEATIQNVTNTKIDDSKRQLNDQLKEEKKDLREKDIEGPWPRGKHKLSLWYCCHGNQSRDGITANFRLRF